MFAKDFADTRTTDVDLWQKSYRNAFNDCMNQYTAAAPAAPPKKKLQKQAAAPLSESDTASVVAAVVKPKPVLEEGSEAGMNTAPRNTNPSIRTPALTIRTPARNAAAL